MPLEPKVAAKDALSRARAVLDHAQTPDLDHGLRDDLLRAALTMGIAALDAYLHLAVTSSLLPWKLKGSLRGLSIGLGDLQDAVKGADDRRKKTKHPRPWYVVKEVLHDRLLRATFQSPDQVKEALAMCGLKDCWAQAVKKMGSTPAREDKWLRGLSQRRNSIVHECDRERSREPQSVKLWPITHARVKKDLGRLEKLIAAIDTVRGEQLP